MNVFIFHPPVAQESVVCEDVAVVAVYHYDHLVQTFPALEFSKPVFMPAR